MMTEKDVYLTFRRIQSRFLGHGYRVPKNWDSFWEKLPEKKKAPIVLMAKYLQTRWRDIDLERYFESGFFVFKKRFSYHKWFDKLVIEDYIRKDKARKLSFNNLKEEIRKDVLFIASMNFKSLEDYYNTKEGDLSLPVIHYLQGKINTPFLIFLLLRGYKLNETERHRIPIAIEAVYRDLSYRIQEMISEEKKEDAKKKLWKEKDKKEKMIFGNDLPEKIKNDYSDKNLNEEEGEKNGKMGEQRTI
jgi:hypothetical protein